MTTISGSEASAAQPGSPSQPQVASLATACRWALGMGQLKHHWAGHRASCYHRTRGWGRIHAYTQAYGLAALLAIWCISRDPSSALTATHPCWA